MVVGVTGFLIIIADGVEQLWQADGIRHFNVRQCRRDGPRPVQGFYSGDQRRGAFQQIFSRRIFGPIILSEHGIGKRVVA